MTLTATDYEVTEHPYLVGYGPVEFSTSLELDISPRVIWDTNRYYADLGISPRATKAEIKAAYLAKNGQNSERLTYVMRQLLNPETRRIYDKTPLGSVMHDYYIETAVREARIRESVRLRRQGRVAEAEVLEEQDLDVMVDTEPGDEHHVPTAVTAWPYSYYVWMTASRDTARLRRWQEALTRVLGGAKKHLMLSVGLRIGYGFEVVPVGYRIVVFLGDMEQPTDALAMRVESLLIPAETR